MVFWDEMFAEVGKAYPDVKTYQLMVDAASMFFVRQPERFEVVVASNLFGDILTDLGALIAGGMGLAAGANLNPERKYPSMFEPIHGSAPDIAGLSIANPMAAIWAAAQMLEHLGELASAHRVLGALEMLLQEEGPRTRDLGGVALTHEVGDAVVEFISRDAVC